MKKIQIIIFVLFSSYSFSQDKSLYAEYSFINNVMFKENKSILICNNDTAIFKTFFEKNSTKKATLDESTNTIRLKGKKINTFQVHNNKKNQIITYDIKEDIIYKISETLPSFDWDLNYEETKKINNYLCNKATVSFRGRSYIAWYTLQIPYKFGPWKFSDLPGLILEIYDNSKDYIWSIREIKFPTEEKLTVPYKNYKQVTLKEYVEIKIEIMRKLRAKIKSVLPRSSSASFPKNYRRGLELIYEWEEK